MLPIKYAPLSLLFSLPLLLSGVCSTAYAAENSNISAADRAQALRAAKAQAAKKSSPKTVAQKAPAKFDFEGDDVNYANWKEVRSFLDDIAARDGFDRAALDDLISKVRYVDTAVQLMKPAPPGKPKNWQAYSARFIEPVRINAGVKFWNENADALARAEREYGVPAEIIVGIIGVETVYGRNTGRFRVLDALATLAFSYPESPNRTARMEFFKGELENALLFARKDGIDPLTLLGSYAGAIGLPQFMPSSIMKYAVDFDGDSHIDLRNSTSDAIGSVANFLVQHGWKRDDPAIITYPATVSPNRAWEKFIGQGLEAKFRLEELQAAGVSSVANPPQNMLFGLIDLQNGSEATEYSLATNNFFAITQYNRSYFYAMSVIDLGKAVRQARSR
ncbi:MULTISPECIES: lytic murein transglycosylase B [unclassified Janthinobacterium]|uniref:lytic murein transglycosylase B n=1 Tax=unclassified Janthinobacterium TaxID=2610881 RepID=UPI0017C8EB6D|nr:MULTISPECIES: lytic murein transglycosylase B [unclassified Janthinobacterium]MBB5369666.1 membrane-bound lytic murein transglycosylase B [Janthinobacterium sp. K2C7]MBB5382378.1 membrane-bound lytic murein transglycosylase B [Janthinobacterium sp. K2Li3]MBB5387955.1 membrane-bound lytic murein transglycosylase B [Janthinobacterium sp. K2E3]